MSMKFVLLQPLTLDNRRVGHDGYCLFGTQDWILAEMALHQMVLLLQSKGEQSNNLVCAGRRFLLEFFHSLH